MGRPFLSYSDFSKDFAVSMYYLQQITDFERYKYRCNYIGKSYRKIMGLKQYISESAINLILEGRMEDELLGQFRNELKRNKRSVLSKLKDDELQELVQKILEIDPSPKKSWRFKIKEWILSGEVTFPEDMPKLNQELQLAKKFNVTQYDKFKTRHDLYEFLENVKRNRGIVDELFNYTFDIDYSDNRFIIYYIQAKDKAEYVTKVGQCTTWCIATDKMFDYYDLPYYLLVDKKDKQQYAIVPSGGQFKDSKQNRENSEKRFEEFDKILDLRGRYYAKHPPTENSIVDNYIYYHPIFDKNIAIKFALAGIKNATVNSDGSVDVDGDVILLDRDGGPSSKPLFVNNGKLTCEFGTVTGDFDCSWADLTTLEGVPGVVEGSFSCEHNKLTTLKSAPDLAGSFNCYENKLTSLEGAPNYINGNFDCSGNNLTTLKGAPEDVYGNFDCSGNNLTTLKGAPGMVEGDFNCNENNLTTLEGAPKETEGNFNCSDNNLTTLEGAPKTVEGNFNCSNNNLTSAEGVSMVEGNFNCNGNKVDPATLGIDAMTRMLKMK